MQDTTRLGTKARRVVDSAGDGEVVVSSHGVVELGRLIQAGTVETDGRTDL